MKLFTAWNVRYCHCWSQSVNISCSANGFYNRKIQKKVKSVKMSYRETTCNLKSMKMWCSEYFVNYSMYKQHCLISIVTLLKLVQTYIITHIYQYDIILYDLSGKATVYYITILLTTTHLHNIIQSMLTGYNVQFNSGSNYRVNNIAIYNWTMTSEWSVL